jgi:hypothetical protein
MMQENKIDTPESYVVFEDSNEHDLLMQLSVPFSTLNEARYFVKGMRRTLYIFKLIERYDTQTRL